MSRDGNKIDSAASPAVQAFNWAKLRRCTPARIGLGRTGASLPTGEVLHLAMAHARARDAIRSPFDRASLADQLSREGFATIAVRSRTADREEYLRRPDLGRLLHPDDLALLTDDGRHSRHRLSIVIGDGLSALAPMRHATAVLLALRRRLELSAAPPELRWNLDAVILAENARVALGDVIGEARGAEAVVILLGERPGLSSPDSLGIYVTYQPRQGRSDAERNCISNVREQGVSYEEAAHTLAFLLTQARSAGGSGIAIKDTTEWVAGPLEANTARIADTLSGEDAN